MASAELRIINRRIKSVKSTKKITRAMELIASSRIVKAQQRDLNFPSKHALWPQSLGSPNLVNIRKGDYLFEYW